MKNHRLTRAQTYTGGGATAFLSKYRYDQGGNLLSLKRHDASGTIIDSMAYLYTRNADGELVHNRLNSVNDLGTAAGMPTGASAYTYDRDGRLARDVRENLRLRWTVDNKISQVLKNGSVFVHYLYDAAGNRVIKRLPNDTLEMILRDGSGVELQRITRRSNTNLRIEGMVLGSEHMGTQQLPLATTPDTVEARIANSAAYELSDHLGNVRVTVSDLKTFTALSASSYSLTARATSATDYYPFGLPSRTFQPGYKWGFNGKENDRELLTGGRMQDYGFRAYRPDLGRFFAVDPLAQEFPWNSTYEFAENRVIDGIDLEGLEYSPSEVLRKALHTGGTILKKATFGAVKGLISYLFAYKPNRDGAGNVVIDNNSQAIEHYYRGGGEDVVLGPNTEGLIKTSKDFKGILKKIKEGETSNPAQGSGLPIDMEGFTSAFHLGKMALSYTTTCKDGNCTTKFIVDDKGFVDPNSISPIKDDNSGPNNEFGGTPYDYQPVEWTETYPNPGYSVNQEGKPLPINQETQN